MKVVLLLCLVCLVVVDLTQAAHFRLRRGMTPFCLYNPIFHNIFQRPYQNHREGEEDQSQTEGQAEHRTVSFLARLEMLA